MVLYLNNENNEYFERLTGKLTYDLQDIVEVIDKEIPFYLEDYDDDDFSSGLLE